MLQLLPRDDIAPPTVDGPSDDERISESILSSERSPRCVRGHAHRRRVRLRDRLCAKGVADGTIARVAIMAASVRERLLAGIDAELLLLPISTASGHVRVLLLRQEGVVRRECRSSSFRVAMLAGLEPHGGRWDWGGSVAQRDLFDAKHAEGKLRIEIADFLGRLVAVVVIPPSDVDAEGEHRPTGAGDVGCGEDIALDATADDVLDQCRRVSADLEDLRE